MQRVHHFSSSGWHELDLPASTKTLRLLPGITWGRPEQVFSPSFWRYQHWVEIEVPGANPPRCRLGGGSLKEETIACMLGGHGLPAETSLAYFQFMKRSGFFDSPPRRLEEVEEILLTPVKVGKSLRRYRFWKSRSQAIFAVLSKHEENLSRLEDSNAPAQDLRRGLLEFPGIGLKTASWIARNWLDAEDVAVIDVHILRSLARLGYSIEGIHRSHAYFEAERKFLALACSLGTRPQSLDLVMWAVMRQFSRNVTRVAC